MKSMKSKALTALALSAAMYSNFSFAEKGFQQEQEPKVKISWFDSLFSDCKYESMEKKSKWDSSCTDTKARAPIIRPWINDTDVTANPDD